MAVVEKQLNLSARLLVKSKERLLFSLCCDLAGMLVQVAVCQRTWIAFQVCLLPHHIEEMNQFSS